MVGREDAAALARERIGPGRHGEPVEIGLYEFDLGYVVWPMEPAPADPAAVPRSPGAARIVVDKQTGEVSLWPSLPVRVIAARYADARAAEARFPADVRAVLVTAGWSPGRDIGAAVDRWLARMAGPLRGSAPPAVARRALTEFGGLVIPQYGPTGVIGGGFTTRLHPIDGDFVTGYLPDFGERIGSPVFPLGYSEDEGADLVIDAAGRVFMLHWVGDLFVAAGIDEAIITLVRGDRHRSYPAVQEDGTW
jgi:SUKH-3 immunity protein